MTMHLVAAANILMRVLALMVTWAGISREKQARALPSPKCDEPGPSPIPPSLQGRLVQERTPARSLALVGTQLS